MSNRSVVSEGRFVARHSLPRGRHVRYALTQPVTRHALEVDAFAVAGSAPVRRGIAVVAVVGGALSVAGSTLAPTPQPPEPADTHADPAAIGLTAQSKHSKADDEDSDDDDPVLDADAVKKTVQKAKEEGSRLAAEDKKSHDDDDEDGDDTAAATAAPSAGTATRGGDASMPADLIDTNDWYLTLPTGKKGSPDTIDGSKLASYHSKFFELNDQRDGIVFTANAGGVTTSGSHYPRSELREMEGEKKASWDGSTRPSPPPRARSRTSSPGRSTPRPTTSCRSTCPASSSPSSTPTARRRSSSTTTTSSAPASRRRSSRPAGT
jgi:hypothetical protein